MTRRPPNRLSRFAALGDALLALVQAVLVVLGGAALLGWMSRSANPRPDAPLFQDR